jgi:formate dehydrogenase maturation protein FdhE
MAVPIADNWKAIHDRMQQIRAEQSASFRHCPLCNDRGWISQVVGNGRHPHWVEFATCNLCRNPRDLPSPLATPRR